MRIGFDISQIVYEGTGVARFTYHLVRTILKRESSHHWTFFFSSFKRGLNADIEQSINASSHTLIRWLAPPRGLAILWNEDSIRRMSPVPGQFDVFLSSDWTQPPPKIATHRATIVHDLIFKKLPDTVDPLIISTQSKRLVHVSQECELIFCDSKSTARDWRTYFPEYRGRLVVNYPGVCAPTPTHHTEFPYSFKKQKYFLAVGKTEPRKNLPALAQAFRELVSEDHGGDYHLVIVGPRGWDSQTEYLNHPNIHLLGQVDDGELASLYQNACALVYPSLYEGFGIPPLEAMALSCPVIMSNHSSLPEIADESCALFIDPMDTTSIKDAMQRMIVDEDIRSALVRSGLSQSARFTYDRYLDTMLESLSSFHP